jgi:hypothetical protein
MSKLVVIRVGDQDGTWSVTKSRNTHSTPESQAQHVRNLFMQGHAVTVLFVGNNDIPLKLASVVNVRYKSADDDSNPELQTYMDLYPTESFDVEPADPALFEKLRLSIKFNRGKQVIPDACVATSILAFFEGLRFKKVAATTYAPNTYIPLNTTVRVGC